MSEAFRLTCDDRLYNRLFRRSFLASKKYVTPVTLINVVDGVRTLDGVAASPGVPAGQDAASCHELASNTVRRRQPVSGIR